MSNYFHPKLINVEPLSDHCLRTTWDTEEILDLSVYEPLNTHPELTPILDLDVFQTVRLSEWGNGIEWFDEEFGADNLYAWAKEQSGQVSHQMFDDWMQRNDLSLTKAAKALGISRRMVSYYRTAQKPVPRSIWLACLGWEATKPTDDSLPKCLPSMKDCVTA